MGRIKRSFQLIGQSWKVLMKDPELMVLPLLSGVAIVLVSLTFVLPMGLLDEAKLEEMEEPVMYGITFLFYVITYTVSFFFQAAVVAGASERMAGGNPTVGSALGAASKRFLPLLMWGIVAATVGMILRAVQERSEVVGRIVVGLIGVAWSFATFFMVPVLVMEKLPVGASFKRSWAIFKQTWGETVVGNASIGILNFIGVVLVALVGFALIHVDLVLTGIITMVAGVIVLMMLTSALTGVYTAAMYRYATAGPDADTGFDNDLLASAYRPKE